MGRKPSEPNGAEAEGLRDEQGQAPRLDALPCGHASAYKPNTEARFAGFTPFCRAYGMRKTGSRRPVGTMRRCLVARRNARAVEGRTFASVGRGRVKNIYILLMRSTTPLSRLVHLVTADKYTHVSIAFDETLEPLYSSTRKNGEDMFPAGPCKEYLNRGYLKRHPSIPCALYKVPVSDEAFERARKEVERFMAEPDRYGFNIAGLVFCQLGQPLRRESKYFCSQFVSEILTRSGALSLPKEPCLMKPSDYARILEPRCCYVGPIGRLHLRKKAPCLPALNAQLA